MSRAVVLDVEGTTSSIGYVHDQLFPYASRVLGSWAATHGGEPAVADALRSAARIADRPDAGRDEIVDILRDWIRRDAKLAPLKTIQGLIWQDALASGALVSHVYDDVPRALRAWTARGWTVHIFSSGSVAAQRAWFRHSPHGDLLPYLTGFFDLENGGAKREPDSYRSIARSIGTDPASIVFLSDVAAELDAARAAGWHTVAVQRDDTPPLGGDHPVVTTFDQLDLRDDLTGGPLPVGHGLPTAQSGAGGPR
ncbi:acireductone synthase [Micromonospora sp. KC207]|uniref:acireductone synthase n=1 Tax=Micromonospora sp. KC207 TaxID=2530377 RepID=UPI00104FB420|nr:acireductone synthase [Micromonospora sp. KC207]TDC60667.1 acireductone synthase [Micromonospora sp. KC207]